MRIDRRRRIALLWGLGCHGAFALGGGAMMLGMGFGMTLGQGGLEPPGSLVANAALLLQFPLAHSALLTGRGRRLLARLAPAPFGGTLATTTFAAIASLQLLLLFALWSPSGVVWRWPEGSGLWVSLALYGAAWAVLGKAVIDGGLALQSGALGWTALWRGRKPRFPDMPTGGLYRFTRNPIYLGFALTLWTAPVWTPDQLAVAMVWTAYCVAAPRLKERRHRTIYGERFRVWARTVPYFLPRLGGRRDDRRRAARPAP